jgi:hypothetical protein
VDDAAAGGHPLHVTGGDDPLVAHTVSMLNQTLQKIGDGLDPAVGVPWKSRTVIVRVWGVEVVKHEKWIELGDQGIAKGPLEVDAGSLGCCPMN